MRMLTSSILCIGSISQDVFFPFEEIAILDTPEDTLAKQKMLFEVGAKYRARDRYDAPGGCATNVSQGLARLGVPVSLLANVGEDRLGESILQEVAGEGVDISLVRKQKEKTDLGVIVVDKRTGERTIFYNRDVNEDFSFSEDVFARAQGVFVGGLYGDWRENIRYILRVVEEKKLLMFANPSGSNISEDSVFVWELCKRCEGVFFNKDEAMELLIRTGETGMFEEAFDKSRVENEKYLVTFLAQNMGARFVVITDGSRGAWAYDRSKDSVFFCEGRRVERVIDATGAGDAFTSGFLGSILFGNSVETALLWGVANATNVIRFYGAKKGLLSQESMKQLSV